jgi:hypothetical protein
MGGRRAFLGIYTTERVKLLLEGEAERRATSMSSVAHELLTEAVSGIRPNRKLDVHRASRSGRRVAVRTTLPAAFRDAVIRSQWTRDSLAKRCGFSTPAFSALLRESPVVMTARTQARLEELARIVEYAGPIVEEAA